MKIYVKSNLLIKDTLGSARQIVCYITEVSTIQGLFHMHSNLSGPTKVVCCREVSVIRGVCFKRFNFKVACLLECLAV